MPRSGVILSAMVLATLAASAKDRVCPTADDIIHTLKERHVERSARTERFGREVPWGLFRKAAERPGKPFTDHDDDQYFGAMVVEQPIERVWMALNDEEHHPGTLPVLESRILEGTPRGTRRVLFQYFHKWGLGRWWVSEVAMSAELYAASSGTLWELTWRDRIDQVDVSRPPVSDLDPSVKPIKSSRGAWMLTALGDRCAFVGYFNWTKPGGFIGATQWVLGERSIRDTLRGISGLAAEHVLEPHPSPPFVRPDGTAIE